MWQAQSKVLDIILKGCVVKAVDLDVETFYKSVSQIESCWAGRKSSIEQHHGIKFGPHSQQKQQPHIQYITWVLQLPVIIRDIVRALFPVQLKLYTAWLLCVKAKAAQALELESKDNKRYEIVTVAFIHLHMIFTIISLARFFMDGCPCLFNAIVGTSTILRGRVSIKISHRLLTMHCNLWTWRQKFKCSRAK